MENEEKARIIKPWINPEERVTVDFENERDLNAEVTGCSAELVDLDLETAFPHLRQPVSVPLGDVEVAEDRSKYTRDPDQPIEHSRLRLIIKGKRPEVV
ncbi:MAG TPA: hypothetical protein VJ692_05845 [Nitrospiraceae bacterium]|nr:hypothetical protein [Nitrospiraceae bacterium]